MRYAAMLLACALGTGSASADTSRPFTHDNPQVRIRPTSALARKLIDAGVARSTTFRRLVQRLESSDVIVYVQMRPNMPSDIGGLAEFMGRGGAYRYLRVSVGSSHHQNVMVALLGHELQHAAEVADAPGVQTAEAFAEFYRRTGLPTGAGRYDSLAAQSAGRIVQAELRSRPSDSRVARHASTEEALLDGGGSIAMP
jgi:hypothetical protein